MDKNHELFNFFICNTLWWPLAGSNTGKLLATMASCATGGPWREQLIGGGEWGRIAN